MSAGRVSVIGAGAWGTALAQAAALAGRQVEIVSRQDGRAEEINREHRNRAYLGDIALSPDLVARTDYAGLSDSDLILMVAPAQATRAVLAEIGAGALDGKPVVLCAKGFEQGTLKRQTEILAELAPGAQALVLSGPSFATDVAAGLPTAVTIASADIAAAEQAALLLAGPSLRPYAAGDPVGVELAGGLKNVYALAAGAIEGAGLGQSARAALLARAFAEMTRLTVALGGEAGTLTGLAGLGDLTLSCTSTQSRNYWFGTRLGAGFSVEEIRAQGAKLAEGVLTAPVALALAQSAEVDAPLIGAVNQLLAGKLAIGEIVRTLMMRPLKRETA